MMQADQLNLFAASIQERFEQFDAAHPEVYAAFRELAVRLLNAGREHYGADAIMQVIRFHRAVNAGKDGGFKINDHYSSRYARKLAGEDARFREFFEFRQLKTA